MQIIWNDEGEGERIQTNTELLSKKASKNEEKYKKEWKTGIRSGKCGMRIKESEIIQWIKSELKILLENK